MSRSSETETKNVNKSNYNSISDSESDSDKILQKKHIKKLSPSKHENNDTLTKCTPSIKKESQDKIFNDLDIDVKLKLEKKKNVCQSEDNSDMVKTERKVVTEGKIIVKKEKILNDLKDIKQSSQEIKTKSFLKEQKKKYINSDYASQGANDVSIKREVETEDEIEEPKAKKRKNKHIANENISEDFQRKILQLKTDEQDSAIDENSVCITESKTSDCSSQKYDNDKKNRKHRKKTKLLNMHDDYIKQDNETDNETKVSTTKKINHKRKHHEKKGNITNENIGEDLSRDILKQKNKKRDFDDDFESSTPVIDNKMLDFSSQDKDNGKEDKHIKHFKGKNKFIDFSKSQGMGHVFIKQEFVVKDETKEDTPNKRKHKKHIANETIGEDLSSDILEQNQKKPDCDDASEDLQSTSLSEEDVNIKYSKQKKVVQFNAEEDLLDETKVKEEHFLKLLCKTNILNFEIPELHTLIKDVSRHPNSETRQKILDMGLPLRQGRFTPAEDKIVTRNWKRLCATHNLPDCPEVFARWRNSTNNVQFAKARRKVILFLAQGLPNRMPVQVYHHFLHGLGSTSKGRFSEQEKEAVELFIEDKDYKDFTQQFLGGVLGRDTPSIWRYIKKFKENAKTNKTKIKWTLKLCETFIKKLLSLMNEKHDIPKESLNLDILKQNEITKETWRALADEMNLRYVQVKVLWLSKLYVQLFVNEPIYLNALRMKLFRVLQTKDYTYWQDADWKEISSHFENYTSLFLWKQFYSLARLLVPRSNFNNFPDVVKILHEKLIIDKVPLKNKRLRRLALDADGNLCFKSE